LALGPHVSTPAACPHRSEDAHNASTTPSTLSSTLLAYRLTLCMCCPTHLEVVRQSGHQRHLRPHDNKANVLRTAELDYLRERKSTLKLLTVFWQTSAACRAYALLQENVTGPRNGTAPGLRAYICVLGDVERHVCHVRLLLGSRVARRAV
jgi:hypothetical protein